MSETTLHFLKLPELVTLHRAFCEGIIERRGEVFYDHPNRVGRWPSSRGRLLEALEVVEEEMDIRLGLRSVEEGET